MTEETNSKSNLPALIAVGIIYIAVTGYFVGLQSPMNPMDNRYDDPFKRTSAAHSHATNPDTIPATSYENIGNTTREKTKKSISNVSTFIASRLAESQSEVQNNTEIQISDQQKKFALAAREINRAFNGAPPTIPHPVDQLSNQSCMTCHGEGMVSQTLRIPKMSHQFLASCTQCHVENSPRDLPRRESEFANEFVETSFVGLSAPYGGPRAFSLAPPQIPHSTWMRTNCLSCHGPNGSFGIRTTHPWRQNCQQCHAPSSLLDQVQLNPQPQFLPPIQLSNPGDE